MEVIFKYVEFDSQEQKQSVFLRRNVLRLPLGLDFSKQELDAEFNQFHFVAQCNNEIIGVLLLNPSSEKKVLKMRQVAIDFLHQGKRIGSGLVALSEQWAKTNGFEKIELHARETALKFYLNMSYVLVNQEFMEVGIPHYKMYKLL